MEDYPAIAALQLKNGIAPRTRDRWVQLYQRNPACTGVEGRIPIGWVLETDGKELIGSIGNFPFAYRFRKRTVIAAAAGDWVVDAQYRGYALQLMSRAAGQEHADIVFTSTASDRAESVYKAFGWRRAPIGSWNKSLFWISNYGGFTAAALRSGSAPLPRLMKYPAAISLWMWDWLRRAGAGRSEPRLDIEMRSGFDDGFDDFWERLENENHGVFLGVRSRAALEWHFGHLKPGEDCWILTAVEGGRMVAYAFFDRKDNAGCHLSRVRIIDFQALKGFERLLPVFVARMLKACRRLGIHVLENTGCWLERADLPGMPAAYRRPLPAWSYYYCCGDKDLDRELENPSVWAPTCFDGDISL